MKVCGAAEEVVMCLSFLRGGLREVKVIFHSLRAQTIQLWLVAVAL